MVGVLFIIGLIIFFLIKVYSATRSTVCKKTGMSECGFDKLIIAIFKILR